MTRASFHSMRPRSVNKKTNEHKTLSCELVLPTLAVTIADWEGNEKPHSWIYHMIVPRDGGREPPDTFPFPWKD